MNILYVEDDLRDADLLQRTLSKVAPHYKIKVVTTFREALICLEEPQAYDLVLCDFKLPDGDGLSLLYRIRERALPLAVVLITGQGDEEIAVAVLKAGAQDYLVKRDNYLIHLPQVLEDALKRYREEVASYIQSLRVLYAEHNLTDIDLTRRHLINHAPFIHLDVVKTVPEVLKRLPEKGPYIDYDVIMLDYRLPGLNALEALKELRQSRGIKTPVVLITGQGDQEVAVQAIKLGAADYIPKNAGYLYQLPGILQSVFQRAQLIREKESLRESEERYRNLFENVPVGIYRATPDGKIIEANPALVQMLGYPDKESLMAVNTINTYYQAEARIQWKALIDREGIVHNYEKQLRRHDGTMIWVEENARVVRDADGQALYYEGTLTDITQRKRSEEEMIHLQEQLRQSQKMEAIGKLAGGIAHDFNNLLTVIKGYSQLSLLELKEGDPLKENIDEIQRASERAAHLTRQLLAFSRRQVMEMEVLDLNTLVRELEKMLRRVIGEDIELVITLGESLGKVKADPGQMDQVMMNLTVNARDAMLQGGKLIIETANVELENAYFQTHGGMKSGRYVMLSVSDTGVGMTDEVREQIFEPFFTTKGKGLGTGLGLSMVYGIIKQSDGEIEVYSKVGQGTTFKIYLPSVEESPEELKEKKAEGIPLGNETILVVEDEEEVRKLAVLILRRLGYRVVEARDMGEALVFCEEEQGPLYLILTDVVMPEVSGPQLVERLRQVRQDFKVLYMSGYTDEKIAPHGVLEKGVNYIQKPFSMEGLAREVREALDK